MACDHQLAAVWVRPVVVSLSRGRMGRGARAPIWMCITFATYISCAQRTCELDIPPVEAKILYSGYDHRPADTESDRENSQGPTLSWSYREIVTDENTFRVKRYSS